MRHTDSDKPKKICLVIQPLNGCLRNIRLDRSSEMIQLRTSKVIWLFGIPAGARSNRIANWICYWLHSLSVYSYKIHYYSYSIYRTITLLSLRVFLPGLLILKYINFIILSVLHVILLYSLVLKYKFIWFYYISIILFHNVLLTIWDIQALPFLIRWLTDFISILRNIPFPVREDRLKMSFCRHQIFIMVLNICVIYPSRRKTNFWACYKDRNYTRQL